MQSIIQCYKNHPSIKEIKESFKNVAPFDFPKPTVDDVCLTIKFLNPRKATGLNAIPLKLIKFTSNVIDSHQCNIIKDLENNKYSKEPKTALVTTIIKKNQRNITENFRAVTILNVMSRIYERFFNNSLFPYAETILLTFISAYRKSYTSNHILLRLKEN